MLETNPENDVGNCWRLYMCIRTCDLCSRLVQHYVWERTVSFGKLELREQGLEKGVDS